MARVCPTWGSDERSRFSDVVLDELPSAARGPGLLDQVIVGEVPEQAAEGLVATHADKRGILLLEAQSLVQKEHMPSSLLQQIVGGNAYRDLGFDVLQLVGAFREDWASIEAFTPVTSLELDEAEGLANELLTVLGENDQADWSSSPTALLRRQAYTHFVRTYEEIRRAVSFLRWKAGDADEIVPSLSAGRRRLSDDEREIEDIAAPVPSP